MNVELIMNAKGGVGKTHVAFHIAEFLNGRGVPVIGIDCDSNNSTFSAFKKLNVEALPLIDREGSFDQRQFDRLVDMISDPKASPDTVMIVDVGGGALKELGQYFAESGMLRYLVGLDEDQPERPAEVRLHTVVAGGSNFPDSFASFCLLARDFDYVPMVLWKNPHSGPVAQGKHALEELPQYKVVAKRLEAIIELPAGRSKTFGTDMTTMMANRHTYDEALKSGDFGLAAQQRLKQMQRAMHALLIDKGLWDLPATGAGVAQPAMAEGA